MNAPKIDFFEMFRVLACHDVRYVTVGGMAAALQGVPINTFDLDILVEISEANAVRALSALIDLDAYSRLHRDRKLRPDLSHLTSGGHLLPQTRCVPLDVLGMIGKGRDFAGVTHAIEQKSIQGIKVPILSLAALIETKEEAAREKDLAVISLLRAALLEKQNLDTDN
jgi:hypothetical protein